MIYNYHTILSAAESFYNQALEIHEQLFGECSDQAISVS